MLQKEEEEEEKKKNKRRGKKGKKREERWLPLTVSTIRRSTGNASSVSVKKNGTKIYMNTNKQTNIKKCKIKFKKRGRRKREQDMYLGHQSYLDFCGASLQTLRSQDSHNYVTALKEPIREVNKQIPT